MTIPFSYKNIEKVALAPFINCILHYSVLTTGDNSFPGHQSNKTKQNQKSLVLNCKYETCLPLRSHAENPSANVDWCFFILRRLD